MKVQIVIKSLESKDKEGKRDTQLMNMCPKTEKNFIRRTINSLEMKICSMMCLNKA